MCGGFKIGKLFWYPVKRNWKYSSAQATAVTSAVLALIGFLGSLLPLQQLLSEALPEGMGLLCRFLFMGCIIVAFWVLSLLFFVIKAEFCINQVAVMDIDNSHTVYVQYGDIFADDVTGSQNERRNIVIPVNRCFDTLVDNDLISATTLHGMAMLKLYEENRYTVASLHGAIQHNLLMNGCYAEKFLPKDEKRSGNLKRFPVGSVAEISCSPMCTYFFLALSTFSRKLKANTTMEDYCLALVRLLRFLDERAEGYPIAIPLMGTHLSRAGITPHDSLEYLLTLLRINKHLLHSDVHVVIGEKLREKVAISGIKLDT